MKPDKSQRRCVVFDLDGTILDTLTDLAAAVNYALGSLGLKTLPVEKVREFVGNGVKKLIDRALRYACKTAEADLARDCLDRFKRYYDAHSADNTAPYDGVIPLLSELKARGVATAVVTNKYDDAAQELKKRFFDTVDFTVGVRDGIPPKPAPDGVRYALEKLNVSAGRAVYVGDGETDIATARNAGLPVVSVTWGFRSREILESLKPDAIIDSPNELWDELELFWGRDFGGRV